MNQRGSENPKINTPDLTLNSFISKLNIVDTESIINAKLSIVDDFEKFMQSNVQDIYNKLNITPVISNGGCLCKLLTHGSTELGISLYKSDIDVVLVLPNYISRNQWFNLIVEKLRERVGSYLDDIVPIIDTFVPVIKLKFETYQFDMVISCLSKQCVPSKIDFSVGINNVPSIYDGLDSISIRGLSSIYILHIIKSKISAHKAVFIKFIRTIKIWTSKREMDSYIFGFPSAIAWVIMALFIYRQVLDQTDTKITVCNLLKHFFSTFEAWSWPNPVEIKFQIESNQIDNFNCERHLMPIISLVYPYKNTAFTVRQSSLAVIVDEFKRANEIIQNNEDFNRKWEKLFQELNISGEYRHFIHLKLVCPSDHFIRFQGLIASKLRDFALQLENIDHVLLARIHSIGKPDKSNKDCNGTKRYSWIIGIKLEENSLYKCSGIRTAIDITDATLCFYHILNEKCPYTSFQKMLKIKYVKGKNISSIIGI